MTQAQPSKPRRTVSMRFIVTLVAVALIAGAVLGVGAVGEHNAGEALTAEIESRLLAEARNLALLSSNALLTEFPELTLVPLVKEMKEGRSDLAHVVVLDHAGRVQGHADARSLGTTMDYLAEFAPAVTAQKLDPGEAMLANELVLAAVAPVLHPSGQRIGTALVGLQREYITSALTAARQQQTLVVAVVLAVGILATLLVMSFLLRPISRLRAGLERIGQGDLATRLDVKDRTELGVLAGAINDMAGQLETAQAEMVEKKRLAHEMELARSIQQSLLPPGPTRVGDFLVKGAHESAAEVGGDYYDIFPLPDGRTGIVIADVAGKGLGGCLVTSMLAVLLRSLRNSHSSPADLLAALETNLGSSLQVGTFITMFYGILDTRSGTLTYASAAHTPLLHYSASDGATRWYRTKGIPIGAVRGGALRHSLHDECLQLQPGDLVLQFTDGINEAWDERTNEQFDFPRVESAVKELAPGGVAAVLEGIQQQVADWTGPHPPSDDETLLAIGYAAQGQPPQPALGNGSLRQSLAQQTPPASAPNSFLVGKGSPDVDRLWQQRGQGHHLSLVANLDALVQIRPWLRSSSDLASLGDNALALLESAIYEVSSNIIEHGYHCDGRGKLDLWWIPASANGQGPGGANGGVATAPRIRQGTFFFCDRGQIPKPREWPLPDLSTVEARRRGRGLGLHIIRNVMSHIEFHPGMPQGNLTLMRFDPDQHSA